MSEEERKAEVIASYLEKFAAIDNRVVTPTLYGIYIEALSGRFSLRQIEKGLRNALESEVTRWPWPAQLAEIIDEEV